MRVVCAGIVAAVTAAVALAGTVGAAGNTNMYVKQLSPMVVGSTFTIQIRLNTGGDHINAVESDFTYNQSVLTFSSIDSAAQSAFEINASATGGSGTVSIARGTLTSGGASGDIKVADVTFNVTGSGTSSISFQGSSVADDASTSVNDLSSMTDGSFTTEPGLGSSQTFTSNTSVQSSNSTYKVIMQSDGNFVEYNSSNQALWSTKTAGNPGARAIMQSDGNFVIYSSSNKALWNSGTNWYNGARAVIQTDGNFVIYNAQGRAIWSRTTGAIYNNLRPNQMLQPGDFLKATNNAYTADMQTDGNFVVYTSAHKALWNSKTSGHAGAWVIMQTDGNLVVYNTLNKALWNAKTVNNPGAYVTQQTDGNLVIYNMSGKALWSWKTGLR